MDQIIRKKAIVILDEWYEAYLEHLKYEGQCKGIRIGVKPLKESIADAKEKILNILVSLELFDEMIQNCTFTTGKPRVNKVQASAGYDWLFSKNRLFVIPTVFVNYGKLGSVSINRLSEFKRFGYEQVSIIPSIHLPGKAQSKILCNIVNELKIDWHDNTYVNKFVALIHEVYGERLDALDAQLNKLRNEVGSKVDELIGYRVEKTKSTEANKFQTKLVNFLKKNPKVAEIDTDLIMSCFHLDPKILDAMQKFLYANRSDLIFVTKQDITIAQDLAKIEQIHNS
jgi:hypothetical protein